MHISHCGTRPWLDALIFWYNIRISWKRLSSIISLHSVSSERLFSPKGGGSSIFASVSVVPRFTVFHVAIHITSRTAFFCIYSAHLFSRTRWHSQRCRPRLKMLPQDSACTLKSHHPVASVALGYGESVTGTGYCWWWNVLDAARPSIYLFHFVNVLVTVYDSTKISRCNDEKVKRKVLLENGATHGYVLRRWWNRLFSFVSGRMLKFPIVGQNWKIATWLMDSPMVLAEEALG